MRILKNVEYVRGMTGKFTRHISVSSDRNKEDSYIIRYKGNTEFRVYLLSDGWYLWYENYHFRQKVKNFSEALDIIEKLVWLCAA